MFVFFAVGKRHLTKVTWLHSLSITSILLRLFLGVAGFVPGILHEGSFTPEAEFQPDVCS